MPDTQDPLLKSAALELATRHQVPKTAQTTVDQVQRQTSQCQVQIENTTAALTQIQTDTTSCRQALAKLQEQSASLQGAFDTIDQIERVVQTISTTLAQVAANVDEVDKVVAQSTSQLPSLPIPFLSKRTTDPVQPYFPPPKHVDIPSADALFEE
ncbi:hypothetical protein BC940DRAFT_299684 [Gongronella butleri]|nr:hypothetical protein BC940DRAFT_299684 [Gongronella butleri]